ncbi:MAG: hypothetical protein ACI8YI_000898, partial [Paracoccaceae bacterium]
MLRVRPIVGAKTDVSNTFICRTTHVFGWAGINESKL